MFKRYKLSILLTTIILSMCSSMEVYAYEDMVEVLENETCFASHIVDPVEVDWIYYDGNRYFYRDSSLCPYTYDENNAYVQYEGPIKSGWIKYENRWYYLNADGSKKTGWLNDNGNWYFLYNTGAMAENTQIDYWCVGPDGLWDGKTQDEAAKMDVSIKTEKEVYEQGVTEIKYTLTNNTIDAISLGEDCILEKYENNKWSTAPHKKELSFNDIAWLVEPGISYNKTFNLKSYEELTPGLYRLNYEGMYSEFQVK